MKKILLTKLQNKETTIDQFRRAADSLGLILALEVTQTLEKKEIAIQTPLAPTAGYSFKNNIILVPILRSGMALLHPFMVFFPTAHIGCIGLKRDEVTAIPSLYYKNLPKIENNDDVIMLDPMIATGGSALCALKILIDHGIKEEKILFAAVIAAEEGLNRIKKEFPKVRIFIPLINKELNAKKFIVPGLGDFGDRYFGTE